MEYVRRSRFTFSSSTGIFTMKWPLWGITPGGYCLMTQGRWAASCKSSGPPSQEGRLCLAVAVLLVCSSRLGSIVSCTRMPWPICGQCGSLDSGRPREVVTDKTLWLSLWSMVILIMMIHYTPLFEYHCDSEIFVKKAPTKPWLKFLIKKWEIHFMIKTVIMKKIKFTWEKYTTQQYWFKMYND